MGPVSRFLSSAIVASMTLGAFGTAAVVISTAPAFAKSEKGSSRGNSGSRSSAPQGKALGKSKKGGKPGYCSKQIGDLEGIELYNISVTAVQGAKDALVRAAARLSKSDLPPEEMTAEQIEARIAELRDQWATGQTRAAIKLLKRQLAYVEARADLAAKLEVQAQARQFASRGTAMSNAALALLSENC